jgi:hypothetical protein
MMFKQLCRLQRYTFLHDLPNVYNTFLHELSSYAYTFLHELSSYYVHDNRFQVRVCSSSPKWTQKMIINYLYF